MTTFLTAALIIFASFILWILQDTITQLLSEGKSFAINETKFY
jgi:hypothetical protein